MGRRLHYRSCPGDPQDGRQPTDVLGQRWSYQTQAQFCRREDYCPNGEVRTDDYQRDSCWVHVCQQPDQVCAFSFRSYLSRLTIPRTDNLNAWVGSATAASVPVPDPGTSTSTTTTSSTATTPTSTPTPTTTSVAGSTWTYQACYDDPTDNRVLQGLSISDGSMSISKCLTLCSNEGFVLGGVEYGRECYCAQQLRSGSTTKANSECNMNCAGNGTWFICHSLFYHI